MADHVFRRHTTISAATEAALKRCSSGPLLLPPANSSGAIRSLGEFVRPRKLDAVLSVYPEDTPGRVANIRSSVTNSRFHEVTSLTFQRIIGKSFHVTTLH